MVPERNQDAPSTETTRKQPGNRQSAARQQPERNQEAVRSQRGNDPPTTCQQLASKQPNLHTASQQTATKQLATIQQNSQRPANKTTNVPINKQPTINWQPGCVSLVAAWLLPWGGVPDTLACPSAGSPPPRAPPPLQTMSCPFASSRFAHPPTLPPHSSF